MSQSLPPARRQRKFFLSNKLSFFSTARANTKREKMGSRVIGSNSQDATTKLTFPTRGGPFSFSASGNLPAPHARHADATQGPSARRASPNFQNSVQLQKRPGPEHLKRRARQLISASTINRSALQSARVNVRTILSARPQPKHFSSK